MHLSYLLSCETYWWLKTQWFCPVILSSELWRLSSKLYAPQYFIPLNSSRCATDKYQREITIHTIYNISAFFICIEQ